jgi:glycosyltransferase involved in cell wall biosynthesis
MISIVVTHQMNLKYLRDCLESIADQNYPDIETILVLDHTEDDVTELVSELQEKINLSVYELEEGRTGLSAARNLGLSKVQGDHFMFLDNDDYLMPGAIQGFLEVLEEDTDIVYARLHSTRGDRAAYLEGRAEPMLGEEEVEASMNFDDGINYCVERYRLFEKLTILACLYRTGLWTENDIHFNEELLFFADAPVMARVFSKAKKLKGAENATYVKRFHNDKVNNPSQLQYPKDETMPYYIKSYNEAISVVENDRVRKHMNLILGKFIARLFPKK